MKNIKNSRLFSANSIKFFFKFQDVEEPDDSEVDPLEDQFQQAPPQQLQQHIKATLEHQQQLQLSKEGAPVTTILQTPVTTATITQQQEQDQSPQAHSSSVITTTPEDNQKETLVSQINAICNRVDLIRITPNQVSGLRID